MSGWSKEYLAWERELANRDMSDLERRLDPHYSTHKGPYPWNQPAPTNAGPRSEAPNATSRQVMQSSEFVWVEQLRSEHTARFRDELLTTLASRPSGLRIRTLRALLGWTQRTAATQLRISVRTLICHERGHHRRFWPRLSLLERLRELESEHAQELIAYLTRGGPEHA